MKNVNLISLEELDAKLKSRDKFEFWNVLTDEWFTGDMIPGSVRIPLNEVGKHSKTTDLPNDTFIVTYCGSPKCPQSMMAAEKLIALGYTNVHAFEGGLEEWKNSGRELVKLSEEVHTA